MKKNSKSKAPKVDPYLEGLMGKLLDRLVTLEKKLDVVVAQTTGKASANGGAAAAPRRDRTHYEAICADCHKVCEVPFRPSENRPVYCKTCWPARKAGGKGPVFPVLTPVAMLPKPAAKPPVPPVVPQVKAKKPAPPKKARRKKR